MLRPLAATVALLLAAVGCAAPPVPARSTSQVKKTRLFELGPDDRPRVESALQALVLLEGPQGKASGVAISPDGKALTAWHVLQDSLFSSGSITRSFFGGRYGNATFASPVVLAACPAQDLALLDLGIPTPAYLSASARGFARGERVFLAGASSGQAELTECTRMVVTPSGPSLLFLMNGPAFPGDSGGGVINQRGELLGILVKGGPGKLDDPRLRDWDWVSAMVPTPARVLDDILRARPFRKNTRLFVDPSQPEGRVDPEQFWKMIRFVIE